MRVNDWVPDFVIDALGQLTPDESTIVQLLKSQEMLGQVKRVAGAKVSMYLSAA